MEKSLNFMHWIQVIELEKLSVLFLLKVALLKLSTLGKIFSSRHFEIFFFFFFFLFPGNRIWHFMQIVSSGIQILFSSKNKQKNIINMSSAEFAKRVVKINLSVCYKTGKLPARHMSFHYSLPSWTIIFFPIISTDHANKSNQLNYISQ